MRLVLAVQLLDCVSKQQQGALFVSLPGDESSDETFSHLALLDSHELERTLLRDRSHVVSGLERTRQVRETLLHSLLDEGIARSSSLLQRLLELQWPRLASIQGL